MVKTQLDFTEIKKINQDEEMEICNYLKQLSN